MPSRQYPFIDIAVHDRIREGFAAGNAQVLLARNLTDVLWVNGAGARLFGYANLYDFLEDGLAPGSATFRQIEAAAGTAEHEEEGQECRFAMRIGSGFRRPMLSAVIERITLPDGEPAYLLTCAQTEASTTPEERAGHMIRGFENTGTHAAVLDGEGDVVASTRSFRRLAMDQTTRARLVGDVDRDSDRLVKHPVRTALGYLPAAIARIDDEHALHLMFAVEMSIGNLDPLPEPEADERSIATEPDLPLASGDKDQAVMYEPFTAEVEEEIEAEALTTGEEDEPPSEVREETRAKEEIAAEESSGESLPEEEPAEQPDAATAAPGFVFNPKKRSIRFLWKIDAEGRFTEISPEFAAVVGPNAADVLGRKFADVAQVFNIDPEHEIADLLQRRDTWSGKAVLWPVQGTDLSVPVDLAALPTYSRERVFDGFRGFGIVRCADARTDPERIGLALTGEPLAGHAADQSSEPEEATEESTPEQGDTASSDTLALQETPDQPESDKVIQLEERRTRPREGLSSAEKLAFREIAEKLGQASGIEVDDIPPFGKRSNSEISEPSGSKPPEAANEDGVPQPDAEEYTPQYETDEAPHQEEELPDFPEPSPPAGRELFADELDRLDEPTVIHNGSSVYFVNECFKSLTGFDGADEVNDAGGLPVLLGRVEDDDDLGSDSAAMTLQTLRGKAIEVEAKLRSVVWQGRKVLMLSLLPVGETEQPMPETVAEEVTEPPASSGEADAEKIVALEVEVAELRSILETATDGVVLLGHDGIIRSLNRSASALFDYDEDEVRGRPFSYLFAHESQRAVRDYLESLSDHGVASVLNDGREVIGREASGRFLPLFMTIGHLSGSNGYCAVMRDITQWKRAEGELKNAKREAEAASLHKSEFLARVSHEIRTPLNAIIGFSDLMAEQRFGPIGSPRYVEYANDIGRSGRHVLDIVNDLLDISKIEAGEQEMDFTAISLNQALLDAVTILQPQANSQRVIIRTSLSSSVPDVVADQRSIKQIAINILSNAVRFTPAGGQAVVSTSYEKDGSVVARIRDTGVGMTKQQLAEAMKPFRQVTASARPRGEGTGLGLPLAKAMTEANRAQFAMESKPGAGTLVEIRFPPQRVLAE